MNIETKLLTLLSGDYYGIHPRFRKILHPYSRFEDRPIRIGTPLRVPKRFLGARINLGNLVKEIISKQPTKKDMEKFHEPLLTALSRIGMDTYTDEWKDHLAQEQVSDIEDSTDITVKMNKLLAKASEEHICYSFKTEDSNYVVLDLGTSIFGSTTRTHLERMEKLSQQKRIPADYRRRTTFILNDVDPRATYETEKFLRDKGIQRILRINGNFVDIPDNSMLRSEYARRVNTVISGAALCHVTDLKPLFSLMEQLLSPKGGIFVWDWHSKSFAAQHLRLSQDGENHLIYEVKHPDRISVHQYSPEEEIPPAFYASIARAKVRTVYEITEEESRANEANARAWMAYWGFVKFDKNGNIQDERSLGGKPIDQHFEDIYEKGIRSEKGFDFIHDFAMGMIWRGMSQGDLQPFPGMGSTYHFIESYGEDYSSVMKEAGLRAVDISLQKFLNAYNLSAERSDARDRVKDAMRFSFGCRDNNYFRTLFSPLTEGR